MSFIDKAKLLAHTNGGLEIILKYYPQADDVLEKRKTHFKIRDEKSESARLTQCDDGNWVVTDFGDDRVSRNGVQVAMYEEKVNPTDTKRYNEVLNMLAAEFGFTDGEVKAQQANVTYREPKEDEGEGLTPHETRPFTEADFRIIFADKVRAYKTFAELKEVCELYHFKAITGYTLIKHDEKQNKVVARVVQATDFYPIYMWDEGNFKKLYMPKNADKKYRFLFSGEKPDNYLYGFKQLFAQYEEVVNDHDSSDDETDNDIESDAPKAKEKQPLKLRNVIICTGGSDAMNVAALSGIKNGTGYNVVWTNSESQKITMQQYWDMAKMVTDMYYLGDIDETGIKKAHETCLQYLDIKKIVLPFSLLEKTEKFRGGKSKDVRDYLKFFTAYDFHSLFVKALPYRFWETYFSSKLKKVNGRMKKLFEENYECNYQALEQFLAAQGFAQYKDPDTEEDMLVHVVGSIVKRVSFKQIRSYIVDFLKVRAENANIINDISKAISSQNFSGLPFVELNFDTTEKHCRYMFFQDYAWKISTNEIKYFDYEKNPIDRHVWDTDIIQRKAGKPLEKFFSIVQNGDNRSIEILKKDCLFFQFLINTCRMHWRVEVLGVKDENGKLRKELTPKEKHEQDSHLINRIFTTGYVAHGFRDEGKAWAPFGLENKLVDDDESSGRSGKSLWANSFVHIHPAMITLDARSKKAVETPHFFEQVKRNTKALHIEDCYRGYDYGADYNKISGSWQLNRKSKSIVTIPFKYAPIPIYTSNFPLRSLDSSTQARFLYTAFSDYYHWSNDEFEHPHQPIHDFKKMLFTEFSEHEWQLYYNTIAQCIQFFIGTDERIDPPMNIINERNLKSVITDDFIEWADLYFITEGGERLNTNVLKTDAVNNYKEVVGREKYNKKSFDRYLRRWCKLKGFEYNPLSVCTDKKNRYVKKWLEGKQVYYIHIAVKNADNLNIHNEILNNEQPNNDIETALP